MTQLRVALDPTLAVDLVPEQSVKVARAAQLLDCDPSTVRRLVAAGELQAHGLGRRGVRVILSSIDDYRDRQHRAPIGKAGAPEKKRRDRLNAGNLESISYLKSLGWV